MSFDEIYEYCCGLQYAIEDSESKTCSQVADEIREKIRSTGWVCCFEFDDEKETAQAGGMDTTNFEYYHIERLEFLCKNEYLCEIRDVCWQSFVITFYGVWKKCGVFIVE